MNHNAEFVRLVGHALKESKQLRPVPDQRSPLLAFFIGVLFGPFGIGIYLKSWVDLFIPLGFVILGSAMTMGLGAPFFCILCGIWGAVRVANSKK